MNSKVDFDKAPTLVCFILLVSKIVLLALILVAIIDFILWEMPTAPYLRALGLDIFIILVCAYFNKMKDANE